MRRGALVVIRMLSPDATQQREPVEPSETTANDHVCARDGESGDA